MKKRILLRLVSLSITSAILLSCGGQLLAAETDEASRWGKATEDAAVDYEETFDGLSGEVIIEDLFDFDNDDLAEQYIDMQMSFGRKAYYGTYDFEGALSGVNLDLYNYLLPQIQAVAAGAETNTYFVIPDEVFSYTFTFAELGLAESERDGDAINAAIDAKLEEEGFDPSAVIDALLFGCPYDMYWMDKTVGIEHGTSTGIAGSGGKFSAIVSGLYFAFPVAGEYKGTKDYTVNSQFGQAVTAAVTNAKAIITANASADDYNKLSAYADAICEMVEYNDEAAYGNFAYEYGNPWQMIWVFDGDDETTVVCEGYSKAFQYLCDNTDFDDDSIYALSVGGNVIFSGSNSGPHMWNIVHMDDGKNYVVDVTAIDTGDSDSFLKGATTTSASGCVLTNGHKYTYSADVKEYFEDDEIIIATEDYEYTGASVKYKVQLGKNIKGCDPELSATKAEEGDKITVTVNPVEGYEFDYIEVNGTKVTKAEFVMPAEDTVVNVVCKKIDYAITCADAKNGTVKTNTNTANVGDEITVTATPADGYELDTLTVKDADGNDIEVDDNGFEMPASDVTVSATFKKIVYKVELGNLSKNCNPKLSVSGANKGDKIKVKVNPVEGYEFDYIEVNGTKITKAEFVMPAEDVVVNVYCKKIDYTITCADAENGTVKTNTNTANVGDVVTVTATPADGYELDTLTVKDADGNDIEVENNEFEMPASDVTVSATFKKIVYKVELGNLSRNCNPRLSASSASEGDKITVTVKPVGGYEFDYIEVNGTKITKAEFVMPAEDVVVNVVCKKIDYTITCVAAENGTVKTNTNTANVGDEITVTATPADGYVLDSITVKDADGNVIELNADNEFRMPMSDVTVSATFKEKPVVKGWVEDGDIWYYIQDDGTKATGWLKVGAWYYFDENGVMLTGWQKIDGVWYCLRNSGSMYAATWLKWGNSWYYLRNNGSMATGWEKVNGTWYLFNSDGVMLTGWQKDNGTWYYLESSGAMKTGWLKSGKDWYYLQSNGAMKTGWLNYNNIWYYLDKTSGAMVTGWKTIDGYKYYFLEDGAMVTGTLRIDGKRYTFDDKGHCLNP